MNFGVVVAALSGALLFGSVQAAPLVLYEPDLTFAYGQGVLTEDPLEVSVTLAGGETLNEFVWWGYHSPNSDGVNDFAVTLNGNLLPGSLAASAVPSVELVDPAGGPNFAQLYRYSLDLQSVVATAGVYKFSLEPTSFDTDWYWQSVDGNSDADTPAWGLFGERSQQVPEPASLFLVLAALLTAGAVARRRG